jgi:hypothetical protein
LRRWLAIRRARAELAAWYNATSRQVNRCRDLLQQRAIWDAVAQAFREFGGTAAAEQHCLQQLLGELESVPAMIQEQLQADGPEVLVVDHSILPARAYDDFYRRFAMRCQCEVTRDAVMQLLEGELLSSYRGLTCAEIGGRLKAMGWPKFQAIEGMSLVELLDMAGLAPRYLALEAWLSHDLWDYAEPLTKVHPRARPELDQLLAEFVALQVPDLESLACPPDRWPYGPSPPAVIRGSDCSVHLCRVLQGFSLASLDELGVCREAYQALSDRGGLHTEDSPDDLPSLSD